MDRLNSHGEVLSQIELEKLPHSSFDRSNHNFGSGKLGTLIPTRWDAVYPGDRLTGRPTAVVNFEPLAGPVMGSMVLKQESFYVPLFQVWKNAPKFFTGKKGFSQPMPSVTPYKVFSVFVPQYFPDLEIIEQYLRAGLDESVSQTIREEALENFMNEVTTSMNNLKTHATQKEMLDLFQPLIDRYEHDFVISTTGDTSDIPYQVALNQWLNHPNAASRSFLAGFVINYLQYGYEFFFGVSTLGDYLGWPTMDNWPKYFALYREELLTGADVGRPIVHYLFSMLPLNWLPWRTAYLIWYWNYRDELLETACLDPEEDVFLGDTVTDEEIFQLFPIRYRCWYKDTYTTALTNTGDGNLTVPIIADSDLSDQTTTYEWYDSSGQLINTSDIAEAIKAGATVFKVAIGQVEYKLPMNYLYGASNAYADLYSSTDYTTSNVLSLDLFDRVKRLRRFTQKKLIVGYEEDDVIWSNFLVRLSNVRMRIPEILSRGRDEVQMQTIVNNTNTEQQIAGDKTAVAWSKGQGSRINYFAEQWGYFMSFLTVLPIQTYTGGLSREFMKLDVFDWMWPDFATMGMDAIYNYELSAPRGQISNFGLDDQNALRVFGYSGRYYDLKTRQDETHGRLRTDLSYLTFSREWDNGNPPKLNYIFVHCHPRTDMFVVEDGIYDLFKYDCYHESNWNRRLPVPSEIIGY